MIKRLGVVKTISECMSKKHPNNAGIAYYSSYNNYDPNRLLLFIEDVDQFLDKDIHVRTEGGIFTIYCNDAKLFKRMCKKLEYWIQEVFEPANDLEYQFMLDNGRKKVICNHLPFQKYQFRIHIKEKLSADVREKLWNWMSKYNGKMRTPVRVANWLMGFKQWVTSPSVYVEDGPTLSMILLFLGDRVSFVEEYVPRSMINTLSEEQQCQV